MFKDLKQYLYLNHYEDNDLKGKSKKESFDYLLEQISDYYSSYYKVNIDKCNTAKDILLSRYARKINLETEEHTDVETNPLPIDSWKFFSGLNLLNSAKTKFVSNQITKKRFIKLKFQNPRPIFAIGLRSANQFPHRDPQNISITCTIQDDKNHLHKR